MTTSDDKIEEQVASLRGEQAERVPADVLDVFEQERRQLGRAGVPQNVAKPGQLLPDAELLDARGEPTTLSDARARAPAVIVHLYRRVAPVLQPRVAPTRPRSYLRSRSWG
jgi:hypothetical protein